MWIIPKNLNYLASARDMVESKEDLNSLERSLEQSLMWRSKPSPLQTWSRRWRRVNWVQHLFGRTLKPCHWGRFEEWLTSSLEAIPVSHSVKQGEGLEQMTRDTSGLIYVASSTALCQECVSLKTSRDIYPLDCDKCLQIWRQEVTKQRGEYSARHKLERHTRGSECSSWLTPQARDWKGPQGRAYKGEAKDLPAQTEQNWPTPAARDWKGANSVETIKQKLSQGKRGHMGTLDNFMQAHQNGLLDQANPNTNGNHQEP